MTRNQILGQNSLDKSKSKILCLLNTWDFAANGEPTEKNIALLIPMGIKTVKRHIKDFRRNINEIKQKEQDRLNLIEERRQSIISLVAEIHRKKDESKTNLEDEWGF